MIAIVATSLVSVLICSAAHNYFFRNILARERKILEERQAIIDIQRIQIAEERRQFFNAIQEKAGANAKVPCRTCILCKRVVHRYRMLADGAVCKECDTDSKGIR